MLKSTEEEEEEEILRQIEAEERAKMAIEEEEETQALQQPAGRLPTSAAVRAALKLPRCDCLHGSEGSSLREVAKRFGLIGAASFGDTAAQIALLRAQMVPSVVSETTFVSMLGLTSCLPGLSTAQLVATFGLLQGGWPFGGIVAVSSYTAPGALAMLLVGWCAVPAAGDELTPDASTASVVLMSVRMGIAAAAVALVAHSTRQLASALTSPLEQAVCIVVAAIAACVPAAGWLPPAALVSTVVVAMAHAWWVRRRRGAAAASGATSHTDAAATHDETLDDGEERPHAFRDDTVSDGPASTPHPLCQAVALARIRVRG